MENTETNNEEEVIVLTAEEFIKALKGEDERFIKKNEIRNFTDPNEEHWQIIIGQKNIIINDDLNLTRIEISNNYDIYLTNKVIFNGRLSISSCKFNCNLIFAKCIFKKGFTIILSVFYKNFQLGACESNSNIDINESIFKGELNLFNNKTESVFLWGGYYNNLKISERNDFNEIIIYSGFYNSLSFNTKKAILCTVNGTVKGNTIINNLNISNRIDANSELIFQNCNINTLTFDNLKNSGKLYFTNITSSNVFSLNTDNPSLLLATDNNVNYENSQSKFIITNSDLGKTLFTNCNFNDFSLAFKSSKISDLFLAGTLMPAPENINKSENNFDQKRLALSQIKKVYENRGDFVTAMGYQAEELETYRQILISQPKAKERKQRWNIRGEKASLYLNRHSTFYGNNWVRGLISTSIVTIGTYTVFLLLLDYTEIPTWREFVETWSYSLEFISPLPKSDDFKTVLDNTHSETRLAAARIWGWISRIIVAYFVYQTIQAFRKFGKKA